MTIIKSVFKIPVTAHEPKNHVKTTSFLGTRHPRKSGDPIKTVPE